MTQKIIFDSFDISSLVREFVEKGNLTYETITKVFGPAPRIPDSPDMDARLDAWNEQAAYSARIQRCEEHIRKLVLTAESNICVSGA